MEGKSNLQVIPSQGNQSLDTGRQRKRRNRERERKKSDREGIYRQRVRATVVRESREERLQPKRDSNPLEKDQCSYRKERGHWAQECPNKWKLEVGNSRSWENSKGISPGGRQCLGRMGFRSPPQGNSEWRGNPLNS